MKVLCCGDREWRNWVAIRRELHALGPGTTIIHGACRGADQMCGVVATHLRYPVVPYPADWTRYGRRAGPIRNRQMLREHPDVGLVLAFHADLAHSKGTRDMVTVAEHAGVPVRVIEA